MIDTNRNIAKYISLWLLFFSVSEIGGKEKRYECEVLFLLIGITCTLVKKQVHWIRHEKKDLKMGGGRVSNTVGSYIKQSLKNDAK